MFERSVARWLALVALIGVLWLGRDILPPFVVAAIVAYLLHPHVSTIAERTRIGRRWVALATSLLLLGLLAGATALAGQRLITEIRELGRDSPDIVAGITQQLTGGRTFVLFGVNIVPAEVAARIRGAWQQQLSTPAGAIRVAEFAIDAILKLLLMMLALVYLLLDGGRFGDFLLRFLPSEHRSRTTQVAEAVHRVLGRYLQGQAVLVVLMSAVTFAVLEWVFHLPYALWIGLLTGVLELVPLAGPVLAGTIAAGVGLAHGGPTEAGWLILTYFVLRQAEDQLAMPLIVGRAVEVHPLLTIFAVLVGERVAGIVGMIVAVPVAAAIKVVLDFAYPSLEHSHSRAPLRSIDESRTADD